MAKVTVVYDRQNAEVVDVFALSESAVRRIYTKEMMVNMDISKDEAESEVDESLDISSHTVLKK
jgi:hypothetical protein